MALRARGPRRRDDRRRRQRRARAPGGRHRHRDGRVGHRRRARGRRSRAARRRLRDDRRRGRAGPIDVRQHPPVPHVPPHRQRRRAHAVRRLGAVGRTVPARASACCRCSRSTSAPTSFPRSRSAPSRPGRHVLDQPPIAPTPARPAALSSAPSGCSARPRPIVELAAFVATFARRRLATRRHVPDGRPCSPRRAPRSPRSCSVRSPTRSPAAAPSDRHGRSARRPTDCSSGRSPPSSRCSRLPLRPDARRPARSSGPHLGRVRGRAARHPRGDRG